MKRQKEQITVYMTTHGIDKASEAVAAWLEKAGKRRRHLLPLCSNHPDGHPAGGDCHWRNGHHLSGLSYNKLTHFHVPSGDSPSGRSAWPAEPGDSAEEISCCIWFQSPQGIAYHKKKHCRNSLSLLRYRSAGTWPLNRSKKETRDSESTESRVFSKYFTRGNFN